MTKSVSLAVFTALKNPARFYENLAGLMRRRRSIARARRQLLAMDDRQLQDIGLTRADAYGDFTAVWRRQHKRPT